ncbi:MAG: hypothetical protein FWC00_03100 [Firmicutes bacterium]|nr:hypothetical protein [Bacillota bacterium]
MTSSLIISSNKTALLDFGRVEAKKYNPADVFWLVNNDTPTKENPSTSITVKEVADFLRLAYLSPVGENKLMIVCDFSEVTPQAQNKMLKTLEDLPGRTTFLLLGTNDTLVLNTIKSRCMTKYLPQPRTTEKLLSDDVVETMDKIFGIKINEKALNEKQRHAILNTLGKINRAVNYNCNEKNQKDLLIMELQEICKQ